ncbi:MAG: hypothetical protein ACOVP4_04850 [Bacteriovoracaceae bacterium]
MIKTENNTRNDQKQCLICLGVLPLSEFYTKGENRYDANCKECSKKQKVKLYKVSKAVEKRKATLGKVEMKLVPVIENYLLKIARGL